MHRPRIACLSIPVLLALASGTSAALGADLAIKDFSSAVATLDASALEDRQVAEDWLAAQPSVTLAELFHTLTHETLSPEQSERLTRVTRRRFAGRDPAGLGVQFDRGAGLEGGVFISSTVSEFAASQFLKPQDEIRTIDGLTVWTDDQVRAGIVSHDPGEVIEVGVMREGRPLLFKIPLGSYSDLENGGGRVRQDDVIDDAWSLRLAREFRSTLRQDPSLAERVSRPVAAPLGPERWERVMLQVERARRDVSAAAQARGPVPGSIPDVVAGGEPRGGVRHEMAGAFQLGGRRITTGPDLRRQQIDNLLGQIARDQANLDNLRMMVKQNELRLARKDLPPGTRQDLEKFNQKAQGEVLRLESLLKQRRDALVDPE